MFNPYYFYIRQFWRIWFAIWIFAHFLVIKIFSTATLFGFIALSFIIDSVWSANGFVLVHGMKGLGCIDTFIGLTEIETVFY